MRRAKGNLDKSVISHWSVGDLGNFYTANRTDFIRTADRIVRDRLKSEEIVQEALLKVILAAPELDSEDHARAYLNRTIQNLCFDLLRLEGKRVHLSLVEEGLENHQNLVLDEDLSQQLTQAEDAAIVRNALSLLSPAERTALVMWELEERSAEEIARELGIKPSAVRHTVSRARASLRKVLSELVIDEERGLTALDLLSHTYKKASAVAKASSKIALSLIVLFASFLGVQNFLTTNSSSKLVAQPTLENSSKEISKSALSSANLDKSDKSGKSLDAGTQLEVGVASAKTSQVNNLKNAQQFFPGLDKLGLPTGFTVADSSGGFGNLFVSSKASLASDSGLYSSQIVKTVSGAANVLITQSISSDVSGFTYSPIFSYGYEGTWIPTASKVLSADVSRLLSGNYLASISIAVESAIESPIRVSASAGGRDLLVSPKQVLVRMILDASKTQVLAQAVYVIERGPKT